MGASDPLRKILEQEGLLLPREQRIAKEQNERSEKMDRFEVVRRGTAMTVTKKGKQALQVTAGMAGSADRAHAVAEALAKLANDGVPIEQLVLKKRELLDAQRLDVPALGLDA